MDRSTRQAALAELWNVQGHAALLDLLARSVAAREYELVHALHEQAIECQRTAPEVATRLDQVAGQLAELHAGLRAAESTQTLRDLLRWQAEVPWRSSAAMRGLLAAVAGSADPSSWPWTIGHLPALEVELEQLLGIARELLGLPASVRRAHLHTEPRVLWPELTIWLAAQARLDGARADELQRLHTYVSAWRRLGSSGPIAMARTGASSEQSILAELVEPWHRLDAVLDRTCVALRVEVVAGQRSLTDALGTVAAGLKEPARKIHRRATLLYHLLDEPTVSVRRAALEALAGLVASPEGHAPSPPQRGILVLRWVVALELHWHVAAEPVVALESALRIVDACLPTVVDGSAPRLARDLVLARARLLRQIAGFRDGQLEEAVRAYAMALQSLEVDPDPIARGRALTDLAGLRRSRVGKDLPARDREIRALYDEALDELSDTTLARARALSEYAIYLARPLCASVEDGEQAMALARRAVDLISGLPSSVLAHPLLRTDLAAFLLTLGNVRLEVERDPPDVRRSAGIADYRRGLEGLGDSDELLAGLLHLNLALVALDSAMPGRRDEQLALARRELDLAEPGLRALPIAHARAITERANIAVRERPDDEPIRRRSILEVEGALHRLPVGSGGVVRARVQRQLGDLYLGRDGVDDPTRAAEYFAAARSAFVEGGATRLAVEVARDYAESQLRQHTDDGDIAALTRGAVVLEQASLLAERRWASRRSAESTDKLAAMLDGVYGDLAWFQAKLERPAEAVLTTVCRAKRYRASPSLRTLRGRAERSAMLSPAHLDPLARRLPPAARGARPESVEGEYSPARLVAQLESFASANPEVLALDFTLTRWGTVVVGVGVEGLAYTTLPLTRETVRRWIWGEADAPGWRTRYLAFREARDRGRAEVMAEREHAWVEAGEQLAKDLGARLLGPALAGLSRSCDDRILLLAAGRLTGLPFLAAQIEGRMLMTRVRGFALLPSLAAVPGGPLPSAKPRRALCILADAGVEEIPSVPVDELRDVVRLLVSAQAEVEVLARMGESTGSGVYRPTQVRTRQRTIVGEGQPTVDAVLERSASIDHLFYGGHGFAGGLMLLDGKGRSARLHRLALRRGSRWPRGSSVFISAATRVPPPADDAALWSLVEALRGAGVGFVVAPTYALSEAFARDFSRSFYLYWALGRSIPEAFCAALVNVAGSDPSKIGAFVVVIGELEHRDSEASTPAIS